MMVNSVSFAPKIMSATPSYEETVGKKDFSRCLESAINEKNNKKLYTACQELESVFLNKVLDSMRQSIPRGEFSGQSFATDTFESMLYTEYARSVSKTGSLGIADAIYKQLTSQI
ncbi:MAG: rod-binding protein [Syntrophomonadaceae bacterium]|nr:rod-binding protein [Syntrophomonadaceae bacterium]MDD3270914.1 rod-binding protein [Syntrophomonadaceae bacterium]MDD3897487.1 rod-binding protein [Syntrophomonadaceae bacterium]